MGEFFFNKFEKLMLARMFPRNILLKHVLIRDGILEPAILHYIIIILHYIVRFSLCFENSVF